MCGRSRGRGRGRSRIISRNRCVGTCARYKLLIINYQQKIIRLTRAYNVNMNKLRGRKLIEDIMELKEEHQHMLTGQRILNI